MKTLTNIQSTGKNLKTIILISLMICQVALKASDVPANTEEALVTEQSVEEGMLNLSIGAKSTYSNVSIEAVEKELKIENWMINPDDSLWNEIQEEEQKIEEWMYDISHCNWNDCVDQEKEQEIEAWMTNPSDWVNHEQFLTATAY